MTVVCGFDLAFKRDASAAAIVRRAANRYTLIAYLEQRPKAGAPLVPTAVLAGIADLCKRHKCASAWGDEHYSQTAYEVLGAESIALRIGPAGNSGKLEVWSKAKELILEGKVAIPNVAALVAQLKLVRSKPQSGGGVTIEQPRRAGSHGDLASAFALALWAAASAPDFGDFVFERIRDDRHPDDSHLGSRYSSAEAFEEWHDSGGSSGGGRFGCF